MPKSVWEKAGDEARERIEQARDYVVDTAGEINAGVDGEADSLLDKLKSSKLTGVIALGVIALFLLAVVF